MEYPYFKGLEADRYSFYRVPKALVKADLFQKMSGDAKLLYAVLLDRMSLSIKNGWQDKHGNAYIICTIEEVMDFIASSSESRRASFTSGCMIAARTENPSFTTMYFSPWLDVRK